MDRGQAYTLEGFTAAILIVIALGLGLQAIDVGPYTENTDTVNDALEQRAADVLDLGADTGALSSAVRCYGEGTQRIDGAADPLNNSRFEEMLNRTFDRRGNEYAVYFSYWNGSEGRERVLVSSTTSAFSEPDSNAVSVTREVVLTEEQPIRFTTNQSTAPPREDWNNDCNTAGPTIDTVSSFYIDNLNQTSGVDDSTRVYNVVEVQLLVW